MINLRHAATVQLLRIFCGALLFSIAPAFAEESKAKIEPLSELDQKDFKEKLTYIDDVARIKLGTEIHGDKSDIDTLQRIANGGYIDPKDRFHLQATGVVLGNLLKKEFNLEWMVYEDEKGRSRALCVPKTDQCLFPTTMISRRLEVGASVNVQDIYNNAAAIIKPYADKAKVYQPSTLVRPKYVLPDETPKPKKEPVKVRFE